MSNSIERTYDSSNPSHVSAASVFSDNASIGSPMSAPRSPSPVPLAILHPSPAAPSSPRGHIPLFHAEGLEEACVHVRSTTHVGSSNYRLAIEEVSRIILDLANRLIAKISRLKVQNLELTREVVYLKGRLGDPGGDGTLSSGVTGVTHPLGRG
ncbi:hypothetical protein ACFE04_000960 [Oxalis oulophora]